MMLTDGQRLEIRRVASDPATSAIVALRARMVLWRDEDYSVAEIAHLVDVSEPTVRKWLNRYDEQGTAGLVDHPRGGGPRRVPGHIRARILALTRASPPEHTGLSHWSAREMAKYLKREEGIEVSHNFIADLWRETSLQPHRQGTFTLSADPDFEAKVIDIVGLYLDPPEDAVVLAVDEKPQTQALERPQPPLPTDLGRTAKHTHDYLRHGTTDLFAALDTGTGQVTATCFPRHRAQEFLAFMDEVVARHPHRTLHVVLDNLSTHSGPKVEAWLTRHPNVTFHFTPTGSSWLNQVETWFGLITRQAVRRGNFGSVRRLIDTINNYVTSWNRDARPFTWTATADEIMAKVEMLHRDFKKLLANNSYPKEFVITSH